MSQDEDDFNISGEIALLNADGEEFFDSISGQVAKYVADRPDHNGCSQRTVYTYVKLLSEILAGKIDIQSRYLCDITVAESMIHFLQIEDDEESAISGIKYN